LLLVAPPTAAAKSDAPAIPLLITSPTPSLVLPPIITPSTTPLIALRRAFRRFSSLCGRTLP
jgi:hypothetical protein